MKTRITTLITDLDDTLWDWVGIWHSSFSAMLEELVCASGLPREQLINEFRGIHQRYGTSEYSFAIEELPSLRRKHPGANLREVYSVAIEAYRTARSVAMRPYSGVMHTLVSIRRHGCTIIGYTESMQFYSNFRLKSIGLDGILDYLYSPADHDIPDSAKENGNAAFSDARQLDWTIQRFTPAGELKPNPHILLNILEETGADKSATLYVGDKLSKDILMAKQAGVISAWAQYGESHIRPEYGLLKQVTHWTPEMVSREMSANTEAVQPDVTLDRNLSQLFDHFEFRAPDHATEANRRNLLTIWEKTVDVQQHFNDLELRIRNYAITVLAAFLALAGLSLKEHWRITLRETEFPQALLIVISAMLVWIAFYWMDRFWYHRLLLGAVNHGQRVEAALSKSIPEIDLTATIGNYSPTNFFGIKVHSKRKMDLFYGVIFAALVFLGWAIISGSDLPPAGGNNTGHSTRALSDSHGQVAQPSSGTLSLRSDAIPRTPDTLAGDSLVQGR